MVIPETSHSFRTIIFPLFRRIIIHWMRNAEIKRDQNFRGDAYGVY